MKLKFVLSILFLLIISTFHSQENSLTSFTIPVELKKNANAVVRSNDVQIYLNAPDDMRIAVKKTIAVLNKKGASAVGAYVYYDDKLKIKDLEVLVYNAMGAQIKKIKKNDFKDVSAVSGGTLYSDSRVKYLEYTPISYPYTITFTYEIETKNTAFIQSFMPVTDYFVSVENSSYQISFPNDLKLRTKDKNFQDFDLIKEEIEGEIKYRIENIQAIKPEDYAPEFFDIAPKTLVVSNQFTLEGVRAEVENWNDFGKWMYHDLIKNTHDLPENTIAMVQNLVKDEPDDIAKAKKIYQYVQDKVRYISVQVGIGGWKPFNASEVDKLGYGDCKALTNYTLALLQAVGIQSNYSVVYAGKSQRSLDADFAAMQGNHVILNIPTEGDDIWLECTSQKLPFGFIGDFTDDRDVLVITPKGGKIQHTKKYEVEDNVQTIKGDLSISNDGAIVANVLVNSKGIQYDNKYWLESETERDLDTHYKKRWRYINDMSMSNMDIKNDKNNVEFIENVSFQASNYSKVIGNRMLITLNALNRNIHIPDRYRDRKLPLQISRGFTDLDEVEINLPKDYKIESLPENKTIESKFGNYSIHFEVKDKNKLIYKRDFVIKGGNHPKEDYEEFRSFYKKVSKLDNTKIALIKK